MNRIATPRGDVLVVAHPHGRHNDAVTERAPTLVELPRPRALTDAEHALVTRLVAFAGVPSLSEQVATVRVVSTCECGCASVGLSTDGPRVPATVVAGLSGTGRSDYFAVSASGGDVSVVLHILSGAVGELEIFAGGEGVSVSPPRADGVTDLGIH
jgi:hypothetical protein